MKKIIFEDLLNFTKNVLNKAGLDIYSKNAVAEGLAEKNKAIEEKAMENAKKRKSEEEKLESKEENTKTEK